MPRSQWVAAALSVSAFVLAGLPMAGSAAVADVGPTFVVTSTGDGADAVRDGVCATARGVCTLRAALREANRATGHVTIRFDIRATSPVTIRPETRLPTLTNPSGITLDGYSQPGARPNTASTGSNARIAVQLAGPGPSSFDGISITAPGNVIRGLAIYNFTRHVVLDGPEADGNRIVGNFICTNAAGTFRIATVTPSSMGVLLSRGPSGNLLGVPTAGGRNVVSGCGHRGVTLSYLGTARNRIRNNVIGLAPDGATALPNFQHGVDVNFAAHNVIGGTGPMAGNVISGNVGSGIELSHTPGTHHNRVIGNVIGTDHTGKRAPAYARNAYWGIRLEGPKTCTTCPDDAGFDTVRDNVIVNSGRGGMLIDKGQHSNLVRDNRIGVLADGTPAGNAQYGIRIGQGARRNVIGPGNVIAANGTGIQMQATATEPASPNRAYTWYNRVTANVIRHNRDLGIDLAPYGVPNTRGVGDAMVNQGVPVPVITAATAPAVSGTTCGGCRVEVFGTDGTSAGTYGEGAALLGSGVAAANGTFTVVVPAGTAVGAVTATTTTKAGSTSEFARNVAVK